MANAELSCESFQQEIEPYLDGELDASSARALRAHAERCATCAGELALARQVSQGLAELATLHCPERVNERVREALGGRRELPRWRATARRLRARVPAAPAWVAAASVLLLVGGLVLTLAYLRHAARPAAEEAPAPYTRLEVARAHRQLEWALAYTGRVTRASLQHVRRNVIDEKVVVPVRGALRAPVASKESPDASQN